MSFLLTLQNSICRELERLDGRATFSSTSIKNKSGGLARPRVLSEGRLIEKAAVNFTHSVGTSVPEAVSSSRKNLVGKPFQAVSLSVIVHPQNPFVPTTHMNLRLFVVGAETTQWHFGGGYDLTPTYGFAEDARDWHIGARGAAQHHYGRMKQQCDSYFYLPHRCEQRGVGGLFFDDLTSDDFNSTFSEIVAIGRSFFPLYRDLLLRRSDIKFSQTNREFQLYRRGRYAEFNLLHDRGTRYGLQSGKNVESVLSSMPPKVSWVYRYPIEKDSPEYLLTSYFLQPRDWINEPIADL